jgi:hypothetical protein
VNNSPACDHEYITSGFEPVDPAGKRHPLFVYFTGTNFFSPEAEFRAMAAPAVHAVTEAMARRGFAALWIEYDNSGAAWASDHTGQLACLFGAQSPRSVLTALCAMPQVDCNLGIAAWGHSLGALVAHRSADFDARVRAAWLTGYGGDAAAALAKPRIRVVNAEGDAPGNASVAVLNQITGFSAAECPSDAKQCLRSDGSGWIIVQKKDCAVTSADHCWFDRRNCLDAASVLEPNWIDPASTKPFALESNADWVAATAQRL